MSKILSVGGQYSFVVAIKGEMPLAAQQNLSEDVARAVIADQIRQSITMSLKVAAFCKSFDVTVEPIKLTSPFAGKGI